MLPARLTIQSLHIVRFIHTVLLLFLALNAQGQGLSRSAGKTLFVQHCSRCHGINGAGGEGPALNRYYLPRASNDAAFADLIANGIPGTSMPGNWALADKEIATLIHYVRSLGEKDKRTTNPVRGDAENGLVLMEKSGCFSCHALGERGVSIGPDLESIGSRRGVDYLRDAITNPGKQKLLDENGFILYLVVEVTLQNGKEIIGIRINEDTFTLQLKDAQNVIYSFRKNEVEIQRSKEASLMPSFSNSLSETEVDDIIAYLTKLK